MVLPPASFQDRGHSTQRARKREHFPARAHHESLAPPPPESPPPPSKLELLSDELEDESDDEPDVQPDQPDGDESGVVLLEGTFVLGFRRTSQTIRRTMRTTGMAAMRASR